MNHGINLASLMPEIMMLLGAFGCLLLGLSSSASTRKLASVLAGLTLLIAATMVLGKFGTSVSSHGFSLQNYVRLAVCGIGFLLVVFAANVPQGLPLNNKSVLSSMDGEFFAFMLFSLMGVMLCGGAHDLVWLFLSLELTSLPTYVLVITTRNKLAAQESGVKYFFLGALSAAFFLYGFTMIYGATGVTNFDAIRQAVTTQGVSPLMTLGLALAILGIAFKIAAVPMHFYTADVYQGACTPMTAFLAFVPKTAGFVSLIILLSLVSGAMPGDTLPPSLQWLLWIMAALTMTFGNLLGLMQTNVKRILAYSSVAHSGYMLVGLLGITKSTRDAALGNGAAAVLFYLVAYGLATLAAFAVLSCIKRGQEDAEELDDLSGLSKEKPALAAILVLALLSLIGLPPMVGFLGKVYLFEAAIDRGFTGLVIIAGLNSAVSAVYYLRIIAATYFSEKTTDSVVVTPPYRQACAGVAVALALLLGVAGNRLVRSAKEAAQSINYNRAEMPTDQPLPPTAIQILNSPRR